MEFRAVAVINQGYDFESGIAEHDASLADAKHVKEMFKHTVFAQNLRMMIDKSKKEIEEHLKYLLTCAKEAHKAGEGRQLFIAIYYSGAGALVLD